MQQAILTAAQVLATYPVVATANQINASTTLTTLPVTGVFPSVQGISFFATTKGFVTVTTATAGSVAVKVRVKASAV